MKHKKILTLFLITSLCLFNMGCSFIGKFEDYFNKESEKEKIEYTNVDDLENEFLVSYEFDMEKDNDEDKLTNGEEKKLGTSMISIDTDKDGLDDYYEVNTSKTSPLLADSDGDGLIDGVEIEVGLDPLSQKTNNENDYDVKFEKTFERENAKLEVSGNGNIYNIYVNTLDGCNLDNTPGVVSELYEFYMKDMKFDEATLTIEYDEDILKDSNIKEENLKIYQLLDDGTFFEVGGDIDEESNKISTTLEHFSKYFVADSTIINEKMGTQVFILLDNSGSMYPIEMCEGSEENDVDFKRVDMAKQLIEMTNEEVNYGLAKFTGTYTELCSGFENEETILQEKLDNIKVEEENFNGTYIATSMMKALDNFNDNDVSNKKYLLMLTDGATTEGSGLFNWSIYDESDVIAKANEKNVEIIVIGLGNNVDETYLTSMTNMTGGLYVYANNSGALETVYDRITARLNYNYVDLDGNGEYDHIMVAETGFDPQKNGFSFNNYTVKTYHDENYVGGQCFGMARFCQLYYKGVMKVSGEEIERHHAAGLFSGGYLECIGYDLSNIEFFSDGTNEYVFSKNNLNDFSALDEINSIKEVPSEDRYCRKENEDGTPNHHLYYKDEYKKILEKYPNIIEIYEVTIESDKPCYYSGDDLEYKSYDNFVFRIDGNYENMNEEEKEIYDILISLHNMYATQDYNDVNKVYSINGGYEQEENFNEVVRLMNNGIVPILAGEGHAVSVTGIYRNIENPLEYTMTIYDNNSPNVEKQMKITKEKTTVGLIDAAVRLSNNYIYEIVDTDGIYGKDKKGKEVGVSFYIAKELLENENQ